MLRAFFWDYERGTIGERYDYAQFAERTRSRSLLHHEMIDEEAHEIVARFGIELEQDARGIYCSMLYFKGEAIAAYADYLIAGLHAMAQVVSDGAEPRLKLRGRKGWRRWLKARGIVLDDNDMISGWQEVFGHGRQ